MGTPAPGPPPRTAPAPPRPAPCAPGARRGRRTRPRAHLFFFSSRRRHTRFALVSWARYAEVLDGVLADREEVVITRAGHEPVVILSLADYESLKETAYLLQNPANASRLLASIERLESGAGAEHELAG